VFFQVPDAPKPVFGRGFILDPCGGAYDAGEVTPRAEISMLWPMGISALGVPSN